MAIPGVPTLPSRTGIAASSIGSIRLWRGRLAKRSSSRNDQPAKASSPLGWGDEEAVSGPDVRNVAPRCGLAWGCTPSPASVSAKARVPPPVVRRRDRRPDRALDRRVAAGYPRCPRPRVRAATRSASWSSTCRRRAARLGPTRGLEPMARDRGRAANETGRLRRGRDSRRPRWHRGSSLRASADLVAEQPEPSGPVLPTGPSATTPRSSPSLSRMGADSMTNRPPAPKDRLGKARRSPTEAGAPRCSSCCTLRSHRTRREGGSRGAPHSRGSRGQARRVGICR
jgi:hypothetical protein